ncbi:acetyl-CoA/propionyl-CoA carboxylase biotin carboxyl carrier protein [Nocardioides albertanoniae]|uniref:biotin carboxylase n=1 Tax=Nocardioides albertanoniae TaxID=1175486 RepID=A0A543AC71_9ACTN|nr:biotin carboxylase N-terminal domain-containing protein [Nocardioides albertanoniae]TQL70194.1 acetyl-CoA/propionyl-CoA carboxylase biotin carboxyl carrier protein [Nocardioides albertanoniae]
MRRVLIANRGEIAVRVVRAVAEADLVSIAVYADQDADALHVRLADEAFALGGATAADSYLSIEWIMAAAHAAGADAVHPGYGFLSESAELARAVERAGMIWIGPTPDNIEALGDKITARRIAQSVGAPLVAGTDRPLESADEAVAFAREHGLPIAIKAAFGGGGRGLKVARRLDDVADAFESASREAEAAFGRGECFVERFLERPRHIEAQVVGDGAGRVVVVGDRDCSLQRRNQKLVEEAPAPGLSDEQRRRIHEASRDICAAVSYRGAGTVEFLMGEDGVISFLEVNTRLQVEHPITEAVTGVDLVAEQLRIAAGAGLSIDETPTPSGHAVELRINAEDSGRGFLPSPGVVTGLRVPAGPGIRWDAGIEAGDTVQGAFDSLIAKLIVHAPDRDTAVVRARRALRELSVEGVATVVPFARLLLEDPAFSTTGFAVHTQWIETELMPRLEAQPRSEPAPDLSLRRVPIEVDGRRMVLGLPEDLLRALAAGGTVGETDADAEAGVEADPGVIEAPVPGVLVSWLVGDGEQVTEGQDVAAIDAMKMETRVAAHRAGVLAHGTDVGGAVAMGDPLGKISA